MKQEPEFIDENGPVYRCHYTKELIDSDRVKWVGSVMPQSKISWAVGGEGWKKGWRRDRALFAEMDQNCNNCIHLVKRIKLSRPEEIAGFACGVCDNPERLDTPYTERDGNIVFAPQDYMGMECFKNRYSADI